MSRSFLLPFCLGLALLLNGCMQRDESLSTLTERRLLELPPDDSRTSLQAAVAICQELTVTDFTRKVRDKFPALNEQQAKRLFLIPSEEYFENGTRVYITTGIYRTPQSLEVGVDPTTSSEWAQNRVIADYCGELVEEAIAAKFPPVKP